MKSGFNISWRFVALATVMGAMLAGRVTAQSLTTLHRFTGGSDGGAPQAGLVLSSNVFYGTTWGGGISNNGTVFKINKDGTEFTVLHQFSGIDGTYPSELIFSGNALYGGTANGGSNGLGTVFKINIDGTGFTNLHNFSSDSGIGATNEDGWGPKSLVLLDNTIYGAASGGGGYGVGTVFSLNTDGSNFRLLHTFTEPGTGLKTLILSGDTLYGTSSEAGVEGTVFSLKTNGTAYATLYSFSRLDTNNTDGTGPLAPLVLSGSTLYGTASGGGGSGNGTVFKLNTNGTAFITLHSFSAESPDISVSISPRGSPLTNADGVFPQSCLVLSGSTLYGITSGGGRWAGGTVFSVGADGTRFTVLHSFTGLYETEFSSFIGKGEGYAPVGKLVLSGNTLYGTTWSGFLSSGTIFSLSLAPQLTIAAGEGNSILTWPTNYAGFDYSGFTLQSATSLSSPVWTTNVPAPVVANGQYTVTNSITGAQQFFRLAQ